MLDGKQFEIGNYGPENVRVIADASAITEPGTYEVPLIVSDNGTRSYSVTSISPSTVSLTFEARTKKLLQIQPSITGLTTPDNYIAPENEITLDPSAVEISGAEGFRLPRGTCCNRGELYSRSEQYPKSEFQDCIL